MLIALYKGHHSLPFWAAEGKGENPFGVFTVGKYEEVPFRGKSICVTSEDGMRTITGYETVRLMEDKFLYPFLCGLLAVQSTSLMAHVSAFNDYDLQEEGFCDYPKRIWVQITTICNDFKDAGIPVVYNMLDVRCSEIKHIWGGDNGGYSPYSFFSDKALQEKMRNDPALWTRFFEEQLGLIPELEVLKNNVRVAKELLKEERGKLNVVQLFNQSNLNMAYQKPEFNI